MMEENWCGEVLYCMKIQGAGEDQFYNAAESVLAV